MKPQTKPMAILKVFGFIGLFFGAQVLAQTFAMTLLSVKGAAVFSDPEQLSDWLIDAVFTHIYEIMLISALLFTFAVAVLFLARHENPLQKAGLCKTRALDCVAAFFTGFGAFLVAGIVISLLNALPAFQQAEQSYMEEVEALMSGGPLLFELLYVCLVGPLLEEILCRGLVQGTLRRSFSDRGTIFLSGLCFALIHGNLYQFSYTLPLGILLAYLAMRFDSILPCVFLHVAFNSANYLPQIGLFLGYSKESAAANAISAAFLLFFAFCIPVGILLLRRSFSKNHPAFQLQNRVQAISASFREAAQVPMRNLLFEEVNPAVPQPEFLIVGLGNPGEKYSSTRHNAGFMALDYIALRENLPLQKAQFSALCGETFLEGKKVLFLKPQTFMNLSGKAVQEAARFYRIPPEKILVIYDDINFEPGELRIRASGSAGGHNGMKSILAALGTENFARIRVGVGAVPEGQELMHWVLGTLPGQDLDKVISVMEPVYAAVKAFVRGELDRAMSEYNGRK